MQMKQHLQQALLRGAHTESHPVLASLGEEEALGEMVRGRTRITQELGCPADHFAYPYGRKAECNSREFQLAALAGFTTAVTTRYGAIYREHRHYPHCLPRMKFGGPVERVDDAMLDVLGIRTALSKHCFAPVVTG
jgi:peptidoglycan/xylan/chitin deacetylase (PgdA/CDA1 family)